MNINLEGLDDSSKVWIYQSNRVLTPEEGEATQRALDQFASTWVAHSRQLKASAQLVENRFIILAVDETMAGATGCSIDSSVRFLKSLQDQLKIDLFDRMRFAYQDKDGKIQCIDRASFADLYAEGEITDSTMVVDTLVKTKGDLPAILKPLSESWHQRMV